MLKELSFEDLTKFGHQRRSSVLVGMLAVLAVVGLWLLVLPMAKGAIESRNALLKEQQSLVQLKDKLLQLEKIKYDANYAQTSQQVNSALQDHKPLLELLASLDQVSRASSVTLSGLELNPGGLSTDSASFGKKNKKEAASSLDMAFKITGTFQQVSQFMELLEKVSPFTTIDSFSVTEGKAKVSKESSESASIDGLPVELVSVSLSCKTYFASVTAKTMISSPVPVLSNEDLTILEKIKEFQSIKLPEQRDIDGGLEDLFGLPRIEEVYGQKAK